MTTITLTIPNGAATTRAVEAICVMNRVEITPANAKQAIISQITTWVKDYEKEKARLAAQASFQTLDIS